MAKQYIQKCSCFRRCMMMILKKTYCVFLNLYQYIFIFYYYSIFIYSHRLRVIAFNCAVFKNGSQSRALNIYLQKYFVRTLKCDCQQRYVDNWGKVFYSLNQGCTNRFHWRVKTETCATSASSYSVDMQNGTVQKPREASERKNTLAIHFSQLFSCVYDLNMWGKKCVTKIIF